MSIRYDCLMSGRERTSISPTGNLGSFLRLPSTRTVFVLRIILTSLLVLAHLMISFIAVLSDTLCLRECAPAFGLEIQIWLFLFIFHVFGAAILLRCCFAIFHLLPGLLL